MSESAIGPYRILGRLGHGGMGEVFLAEDPRLGRRVAIKTLSGTAVALPDARQRLVREARAAAQLNHPNIAAIYDIVESEGATHVVMELVQGESLAARVRKGPMPHDEVATLGIQLASALAMAHDHGIVHRDLKPANVQLTPTGSVKVLDFGLAKSQPPAGLVTPLDETSTSGQLGLTTPGEILGTPAYMSPEQFRGQPADHRSDLYSLGVLLFELLTAKRPYEAPDFVGLALVALSGPMPLVRDLVPDVPEGLNQIVARAMERLPEDRYQSAGELQRDLAQFAAHSGDLPTRSVVMPLTVPRGFRAHARRPAVVAGMAVLLLAAAAGAAWLSLRRPAPLASPRKAGAASVPVVAVLPLTNASGDPANDHIGVGIADALISDLASLASVSVLSRASTLQARSRVAMSVAQELGATFVVSGTVQRAGDVLKVSLSLVRGDGSVAWGYNYEGRLSDIFVLQRQLAEGVGQALQLRLSESDRQQLSEPPTSSPEAFAHYSEARALLDRPDVLGNVERAIVLFQAAAAKDPRFALAFAGLADACWARYEETRDAAYSQAAMKAVLQAVTLKPSDPQVKVSLAVLHKKTGKPELARDVLKEVLAVHPANDEALQLYGEALIALGQVDAGLAAIRTAVRVRPAWRNESFLGLMAFETGHHEEALAAFQRVLALQPDSAWGFQMAGYAQHALGHRKEALDYYNRSLALQPDAMTLSNLGVLQFEEGHFTEAAATFQRAIVLEPKLALLHRNLGDTYRRLGDETRARAAFERALALVKGDLDVAPDDPVRLGALGVYAAKLGRLREAKAAVERAREIAPRSGEVLYRAAVVHALAGESEPALAALEAALANGWSAEIARTDADLDPIRGSARFQAAVAGATPSAPAKEGQ